MSPTVQSLIEHIQRRLHEVQRTLGPQTETAADPEARFSDVLDSMGMVEFLACLAEDCTVAPEAIERAVDRHFGTVGQLAAALVAAGILPHGDVRPPVMTPTPLLAGSEPAPSILCWLGATTVRLPQTMQAASTVNALLGRPPGWLERHAGIHGRGVWADEDPVAVAVETGCACFRRAGLKSDEVGALLVTSEAPPVLLGLGAALHHRLGLRPSAVPVEVGGACTAFLMAIWLARSLLPRTGPILVIALEAPSRHLTIQPGATGEAAALFGDASAACVVCQERVEPRAVPVNDIALQTDGAVGGLLQVVGASSGRIEIAMEGSALAGRAVTAMAEAVRRVACANGTAIAELKAVVAHGGNGRMSALLARRLGVSIERVWSETARTGNLGSASLPVAWASHEPHPMGPIVWTAVGAGLSWGAALLGRR
jgi:3-oxoacyl-[acyl-carrier-protein] synthase-3